MGPTAAEPTSAFASIDIGSHTIRLLIAELKNHQEIFPVRTERVITRLAKDFHNGKRLSSAGMKASITALKAYQELLLKHRISSFVCGATGVLRRASNAGEFIDEARKAAGLNITVLSEASEALLSARGTLSVLGQIDKKVVLFDLGGSSTEFTFIDPVRSEPVWSDSVFIGAATLTDEHLSLDPPDEKALHSARTAIQEMTAPALARICTLAKGLGSSCDELLVVGTAGTVTTLAAMYLQMTEYTPYRVNGLSLDKRWLRSTIDRLAGLSISSRQGIPGLEAGREDIILGGALIALEILENLRQNALIVTDAGLLEGLLIDLIEEQCGIPHALRSPLTWHGQKM